MIWKITKKNNPPKDVDLFVCWIPQDLEEEITYDHVIFKGKNIWWNMNTHSECSSPTMWMTVPAFPTEILNKIKNIKSKFEDEDEK